MGVVMSDKNLIGQWGTYKGIPFVEEETKLGNIGFKFVPFSLPGQWKVERKPLSYFEKLYPRKK